MFAQHHEKTTVISYRIAASTLVLNPVGQMLLVREADPRARGKVNLPGGHIEDGESVAECATRELQEETGLQVSLEYLLGIYLHGDLVNVVFVAYSTSIVTRPGADILSCEWVSPADALSIPEGDMIRPEKLHAIVEDLVSRRRFTLDAVRTVSIKGQ
jgi:8-oxo-dGTP pyrophosphatase MutT (NUDIX family)